jgi:hypothetical protein
MELRGSEQEPVISVRKNARRKTVSCAGLTAHPSPSQKAAHS